MDRRAWQATYNPWGCKESDTTEHTRTVKNKILFFNGCYLEQDKDGGRMTMCLQYSSPDRML